LTAVQLIDDLGLPAEARVDQRIPKQMIVDNARPNAADRRCLREAVERVDWVASLKPSTSGVPAVDERGRAYVEIAVVAAVLRATRPRRRLAELLHRTIPYPVVLLGETPSGCFVSLAHKRESRGAGDVVVVDGELVELEWDRDAVDPAVTQFRQQFALELQARTSLASLYSSWVGLVLAALAARLSGHFEWPLTAERTAARQANILLCSQLDSRIARLRAAAHKERQLARRVELNVELRELQDKREAALRAV
jgi:hypothetical protein